MKRMSRLPETRAWAAPGITRMTLRSWLHSSWTVIWWSETLRVSSAWTALSKRLKKGPMAHRTRAASSFRASDWKRSRNRFTHWKRKKRASSALGRSLQGGGQRIFDERIGTQVVAIVGRIVLHDLLSQRRILDEPDRAVQTFFRRSKLDVVAAGGEGAGRVV